MTLSMSSPLKRCVNSTIFAEFLEFGTKCSLRKNYSRMIHKTSKQADGVLKVSP